MSSQLSQDQDTLKAQNATVFDRIFRDREGHIVIAQAPNLPILVWLTATALQFVVPEGNVQTALQLISFGTLFTWAWLELFSGVNYFRRSLGLIVLVGLLALGVHLTNAY